MFSYNLILFFILRSVFMVYTDRKKTKNGDILYTYYVSIFFQLVLLPIFVILYFNNLFSYLNILHSGINYFLSDYPELLYQRDYKYLIHHTISIVILITASGLPEIVHGQSVINLFLLELGSSIISIPTIFPHQYVFRSRPYVFMFSRLLTLWNTYYIIINPVIHLSIRVILTLLSILLMVDNTQLLIKLCKKNIKYT